MSYKYHCWYFWNPALSLFKYLFNLRKKKKILQLFRLKHLQTNV